MLNWGSANKTTFEPEKSYAQVFSRKANPIDPYGRLFFGDYELSVVETQKVVGYTLDSKLTWVPMIESLAKKARVRLAALVRLSSLLDSENMKTMYTMFIRSILEYGNIVYMGACPTVLSKLDRVQAAAEKVGKFTVESLEGRREEAAISFALKLMDGKARGPLKDFIPVLYRAAVHEFIASRTRGKLAAAGLQVAAPRPATAGSLDSYKYGFWGALPRIWAKLPQDLVMLGAKSGWLKIKSRCTRFLRTSSLLNPNAASFKPICVC